MRGDLHLHGLGFRLYDEVILACWRLVAGRLLHADGLWGVECDHLCGYKGSHQKCQNKGTISVHKFALYVLKTELIFRLSGMFAFRNTATKIELYSGIPVFFSAFFIFFPSRSSIL